MSKLFNLSYPEEDIPNILFKNSHKCNIDLSIFKEYNKNLHNVYLMEKTNKNVKYLMNRVFRKPDISNMHYVFHVFGVKLDHFYSIRLETLSNKNNCCILYESIKNENGIILPKKLGKANSINRKFKTLICTQEGPEVYNFVRQYDYCGRQKILNKNRYKVLYSLYNHLELGGNFVFVLANNYCSCQDFEIIYVMSLLFEKITICDGIYCHGENYLGEKRLKKNILQKMYLNSFVLTPKPYYKDLIIYLKNMFKAKNDFIIPFLTKNEDTIIKNYYNFLLQMLEESPFTNKKFIYKQLHFHFIESVRRTIINNNFVRIHSAIKKEEGNNIKKIIKKYKLSKCIEIGMAFGISASYILSVNEDVSLISIDPNQSTQWKNYGIKLLKEFGYNKRHKLMEETSYLALPKLLRDYGEGSFDFVFIDGFHTFEMTNLDFFYAVHLIKVGGVILIDDVLHKSVAQSIKFFDTNYPHLQRINVYKTQAAYLKKSEDTRNWDFYAPF